jgi:RNA polymerase sigma-70 factor (ECF subfamily)
MCLEETHEGRVQADRLPRTVPVIFDALVSSILGIPMSEGPDAGLVLEVLDGDSEATSLLVRRFSGRIFGLAYRMTGNSAEAEDLCQDILLRVLEGLPRFDRTRPLEPWVRKIAVRHVLNRLERGPHRRETATLLAEDPHPSPSELLEASENVRRLNQALLRLPEKQRLAIALKYQEELSSEEISKLIGVPRNTVKTWLLRARENLKKELSGAV